MKSGKKIVFLSRWVVFGELLNLDLFPRSKKKSKREAIALKPSNIQSLQVWKNWIKSRTSEEFKVKSDKYRELRKAQVPHTTSRKGMVRLAHEMKKKSTDPSKVTRSKVWIAGHTHSNGNPVRPEFADTIERIKSIDSELLSTGSTNVREDAVSQVLGKDRHGRLRGMGRGVTATRLTIMQARDSHVQKLEAKQVELINKIDDLQAVVHDLAKGKKSDDVSLSEASNAGSKVVVRCQLLDWLSTDDVVVGEGEFCSSEPMYKIGRVPIGPSAAAVLVTSVSKEDAYVWRPTSMVSSLGQFIGSKIPWPADKIILDNEMESPVEDRMDGSSVSHDRYFLLDWNLEDVIVAEASLFSTDPKELLPNSIPLGPNAAIVKVEKVVQEDAYLWRPPTTDVYLMGKALHQFIAWPILKVQPIHPTPARTSEKASSPGSVSCSLDNSSGAEKKCELLDCNNSGQVVAEGKVCPSKPTDIVHCSPLGSNASRVWVIVSKIGDAKVWRPSSEVEIIADAIGTIVAWPNDKIKVL